MRKNARKRSQRAIKEGLTQKDNTWTKTCRNFQRKPWISGVKKGRSMSKGPGVETCQPVEGTGRKPSTAGAQ